MIKFKVLLVDDEEELVDTLTERLMLRGIETVGVISGAEAIRSVKEREFDIVVLDVKMPGMDGLEVLREIKRIRPKAQIILLTGRGSAKESQMCLEQGAFDYLIKPINIEDLIQKMKDAMGG
jgi:DNA-binding response OmpR family regulator